MDVPYHDDRTTWMSDAARQIRVFSGPASGAVRSAMGIVSVDVEVSGEPARGDDELPGDSGASYSVLPHAV